MLTKAFKEGVTCENIKEGFERACIWPFNKEKAMERRSLKAVIELDQN